MRDLDCRWITIDQHFKYSTCLLKKAFADKLYDKLEEQKMHFPYCTSEMNCSCSKCDGCGFDNVRDADGIKRHNPEKDEADAEQKAASLIASMSGYELREVYIQLAQKALERAKMKLDDILYNINDREKEIQELQNQQRDIAQNLKKISHLNIL